VFKNTFFKHIIVKQPEKIQKIGTLGMVGKISFAMVGKISFTIVE
jgi:hypothetical protein